MEAIVKHVSHCYDLVSAFVVEDNVACLCVDEPSYVANLVHLCVISFEHSGLYSLVVYISLALLVSLPFETFTSTTTGVWRLRRCGSQSFTGRRAPSRDGGLASRSSCRLAPTFSEPDENTWPRAFSRCSGTDRATYYSGLDEAPGPVPSSPDCFPPPRLSCLFIPHIPVVLDEFVESPHGRK